MRAAEQGSTKSRPWSGLPRVGCWAGRRANGSIAPLAGREVITDGPGAWHSLGAGCSFSGQVGC